jgi:hypothetical protein
LGWWYAPTNPTNTVQTLRTDRTLQQESFKFTEKRNRDEEIKKEIHRSKLANQDIRVFDRLATNPAQEESIRHKKPKKFLV